MITRPFAYLEEVRMRSSDSSSRFLNGLSWFAFGAGLGTAVMYFTDPVSGRRRRAYVRDQSIHLQKTTVWYALKQLRNVSNRVQGLIAEMNNSLRRAETPSDQKLECRVRSELGRLVEHPSGFHIMARAGVITLDGKVHSNEITRLYAKARAIRGVKRVINHLEALTTEEPTTETKTTEPQPSKTTSGEAVLH
jgi:hypothetical protein